MIAAALYNSCRSPETPDGGPGFSVPIAPSPTSPTTSTKIPAHRHDTAAVAGNLVKCASVIVHKTRFQEKIFRWISGHNQFREHHQIRLSFTSFFDPGLD